MKHPDINDNLALLSDCYKVTFVKNYPCENLDSWDAKNKSFDQLGQNDLTGYDFEFDF